MVISGNLELVLEAFDSAAKLSSARGAQLRQLLDSAKAATERAAKITQQLLAFAQRSTFTTETVRVTDLLAVSEGFLRRAAGEAIEVAFAGASDLWHCPGRSSSARGRHPQPRPLPSRRSAWKASARGCHLVSCFPDGRQPQGEVRAADHAKARPDKQGKGARFRGGRAKNLG
jgi:hypothetical protein